MIKNRIEQLRLLMKENGIDIYYVPTSDFHDSEYVADFFKAREFMTGFTGSAGVFICTQEEAGLWTDGRYFIQAENQIKDTGITLHRMGTEGVLTPLQYLESQYKDEVVVGFDGRVVSTQLGISVENGVNKVNGKIVYDLDLVDKIWSDRPSMPTEKAFLLDLEFTGRCTKDKIEWLQNKLREKNYDVHIMSSLDDLAWLFNIRGNDVKHTPVVYSYAIVTQNEATYYVDQTKLDDKVKTSLNHDGVTVKDYTDFLNDVKELKDSTILADKDKLNYATVKSIDESNKVVSHSSFVVLEKSQKNEVEIENLRKSHVHDGVAVTEFIYWVKNKVGKMPINEISAADYLEKRRRAHGAKDLSFGTICAYNANAAMMHYSATPDNFAELKPEGMLLVDSGGQYLDGTTDITRTIALGPVSDTWKKYNTAVLKGMLNLSNAKFLYGCTGINLDILARGPVWQLDIDYQCGTGHGVGYMLGVHEGPHGIRWRGVNNSMGVALEKGMVVTNEPGIYHSGECGIRIENELVVKQGVKNFYGQFMEFETITFAPIDLDLVVVEDLTHEQIEALNNYHKEVYAKLSPYLSDEINVWLKYQTREI